MIDLIILMGKTSTGKDTILKEIQNSFPDIHTAVSYTTRAPRPNEINGREYWFIGEKNFSDFVIDKIMMEHTTYKTKKGSLIGHYGLGKDSLDENKVNMTILNPYGVNQILKFKHIKPHIYLIEADEKTIKARYISRTEGTSQDYKLLDERLGQDNYDFQEFVLRLLPISKRYTNNGSANNLNIKDIAKHIYYNTLAEIKARKEGYFIHDNI
jgi:guanylate kinase